MKKSLIFLLFSAILLISPLALAQEETQIYSTFDRFIDSAKMFFSFGDKKVMLALEIREKELNSAIINIQNRNDEEAEKNLERARKKLQFVQNKVSEDSAENVRASVNKIINKINEGDNLSDGFETYILEEEKTGLISELATEVKTDERQTEISEEIIEIDNKIMEISHSENTIETSENEIDTPSKSKDNEDVKPKPNVFDDEVDPGPEGIVGSEHEIVDDD